MHTQKGFSLVEVLVTISLASIVALIATPNFHRYSINTNLRSAAMDIAADFGSLKERALSENTSFEVVFDRDQNIYTIQRGGVAIETKTPNSFGNEIRITSVVYNRPSNITFETRGTASGGSVNLTNSRGSTATVTTTITGKTHVQFNML